MKSILRRAGTVQVSASLAAFLLFACAKSQPEVVGSVHVKSLLVGAGQGATLTVAVEDYAPLAGTSIVIPAGSLAEDTKITIGVSNGAITSGDVRGPVVIFGPSTAVFNGEAPRLAIPFQEPYDARLARVFWQPSEGGPVSMLGQSEMRFDSRVSAISFSSKTLGSFQGAAVSISGCDPLLCASSACVGGRCVGDPCALEECGPGASLPNACPSPLLPKPPRCAWSARGRCEWLPSEDPCGACDSLICPDNRSCVWNGDSVACCEVSQGSQGTAGCSRPSSCREVTCRAPTVCQESPFGPICVPFPCEGDDCVCPPNACSSSPVGSWMCESGRGGWTGACLPTQNNDCAPEISWCMPPCAPTDCPAAPSLLGICSDGSDATAQCRRKTDGECVLDFVCPSRECLSDSCSIECNATGVCGSDFLVCRDRQCLPFAQDCGSVKCDEGEVCCNPSCGICARPGETCFQDACTTCLGEPCPGSPAGRCTNAGCLIKGGACGSVACPEGTYCCNPSCGTCVAWGESCDPRLCNACGNAPCAPGSGCGQDGECATPCDPTSCGSQPPVGNWSCEDGTTGGVLNECVSGPNGCEWKIRWCAPACSPDECVAASGQICAPDACRRDASGVCRCP